MKLTIWFTLIALSVSIHARATETFTFYIYTQENYYQGPWIRMNYFEQKGNYQYLHPIRYDALLSISDDGTQLFSVILQKVIDQHPERYSFDYTLTIKNDSVLFSVPDSVADAEIIRNELTASFLLNGAHTFVWQTAHTQKICLLTDITVPYMDLILPTAIKKKSTIIKHNNQ